MKPDDKYKARLHYQDYDYEVKLPEVEKEGYALHVERKDSVLRMIIQGSTESKEELGIQIQCNGVSKAFRKLSPADMRKDTVDIFWASPRGEPNHSLQWRREDLCRPTLFRQPP